MADGSYNILVGIEPDVTGLQAKLDKQTKNVRIKTSINMGQKDIDAYVKQWNNQISRMQFKSPDIFKNEEVQANLKVLQDNITSFSQKGGASVQDVRGSFDDLRTSVTKVGSSLKNTSKDGYAFSTMLEVAIKKVAIWLLATQAIYGSLRKIEEGTQFIKDLNKELTNVQIVTGMTAEEVDRLAIQYNKLAKEMGATTIQVAEGSLEWFRQGKTIEETSELMKSTLMLSKLGNMEAADATEKLTSTLNGFKLEAEDASLVVDKIIDLDNRMATSANELSTALQYSAASAQQAGVSFEELLSYVATISSVSRRSAESIGQSMKTMFARLENIKLGKMFEDDTTNINDVERALGLVNIRLRDTATSFRPMGDVMDEIAEKWSTMNEIEQSAVANAIAGKIYARTHSNM
jgi:TP901 family phage tail tape measure protein